MTAYGGTILSHCDRCNTLYRAIQYCTTKLWFADECKRIEWWNRGQCVQVSSVQIQMVVIFDVCSVREGKHMISWFPSKMANWTAFMNSGPRTLKGWDTHSIMLCCTYHHANLNFTAYCSWLHNNFTFDSARLQGAWRLLQTKPSPTIVGVGDQSSRGL